MVVLVQTNSNTRSTLAPPSDRLKVRPAATRTRVNRKHRAKVVELYVSGMSAPAVSDDMGLGKATVLRILKESGVPIRPRGGRIT